VGHVARMGKGRGVYRVLVGRPGGRRPLGRRRHRRNSFNSLIKLKFFGFSNPTFVLFLGYALILFSIR